MKNEMINVKISNLTGCDNKTVKLRTNPCTFAVGDLNSCVLKDGKCELQLIGLEDKRYYVCIDKNDKGSLIIRAVYFDCKFESECFIFAWFISSSMAL